MSFLIQDLKSGLRILLKNPGSAFLGLIVLTLGIGMNAAMFSIVSGIVLKGLPVEDADRLMHVDAARPERGYFRQRVTLHEFLDWREQQSSFESFHAFRLRIFFLSESDESERLSTAQMTPGAFQAIGVQPMLGREFGVEDSKPGAEAVAIVGHGLWKRRLAADPDVVGQEVRINGKLTTVIGVMPESFRFPSKEELWLPLPMDSSISRGDSKNSLHVFGRLKEGASQQTAFADLSLICRRMAEQFPETDAHLAVVIDPYSRFFIGEDQISLAWTCLGAVGFLLLIACANVANLLLARASDRSAEMALRLSMGAKPGRIIAQVLSETLVLTSLAAPTSLGLALVLTRTFNNAVAEEGWPFWIDVGIETSTFMVLVVATLLSALIAGLAPALQSIRIDLSSVLGDRTIGSRTKSRLSAGLVIVEVALSCILMIGAGLMVRSIIDITHQETAFSSDGVATGRILLFVPTHPTREDRGRFWSFAGERLRALPGVSNVGFSDYIPGVDQAIVYYFSTDHAVYPKKEEQPDAGRAVVSEGWFETLEVKALRGRLFAASDSAKAEPVAIVTDAFARRYWPDKNPVGRWIQLGAQKETEDPWRRVVGVVPDLFNQELKSESASIFIPLAQSDLDFAGVVARSHQPPGLLAADIKQALHQATPGVPFYHGASFQDLIVQETFVYRLVATLFSMMAGVGLLLAGTGLYGILAFFVSKRTAEAGLRAALGANRLKLAFWIAGHALRHVTTGLCIGLVLALALSRLLSSSLPEISASDPLTFASVAVFLLLVGLVSTIAPAWRAARIDPATALRQG